MAVADVTVVIPSIPPRAALLTRAIESVRLQTMQPKEVSVSIDEVGIGASSNRNIAAREAKTEWLMFLDDDDEFLPHHIATLVEAQKRTGADYLFSDFTVPEAPTFRLESFCHGEFDPEDPRQTTITIMIRRSVFEELGGYLEPNQMLLVHGDTVGEDFDFTKRCAAAGVTIHHEPVTTWLWHHHWGNTSGRKWNR